MKYIDSYPTPVRLDELRPALQQWASEIDRSENYLMKKIVEEALIKERGFKKDHFKKMREQQKKTA